MQDGQDRRDAESWPVRVPLVVRERDCGPGELLDESVLLVFFREARRAYLSVLNASLAASVLLDIRMTLHRPISSDDELAIEVRCDGLAETGFRMAYRVRDVASGETFVEGATTSELVDDQGRPAPVPDDLRLRVEVLEGWLD